MYTLALLKSEMSILLMLLTSLACSNALPVASDDQSQCVKVDQCSCRLENVDKPGLIDLHSLVTGHQPTFHDQEKSNQTGLVYDFYYNPCLNFSDHGCPEPALCQTGYNSSIDLGNLDYVEFEVEGDVVTAIYKSKFNDRYGQNRTTEVTLVCDETAKDARFVFISEPVERYYKFELITKCACPGGCASDMVTCEPKDLCTCEMSDGSGTINLHSLSDSASPLSDQTAPLQSFFYNPCSSVTSPDCNGHSVCEQRGGTVSTLGLANSAKFVYMNGQLSIEYTGSPQNITSVVNLTCDHGQREEPFFRADCNSNIYNLYSVCACPNGCDTPPPGPSCDQTDSCTCKSTSDGAVIDLHVLDNPIAPLTGVDNEGYTYYYNPCSGLELQNEIGRCHGVSACQEDPFHKTYYNLGEIDSVIKYNATEKQFTFQYSAGEGGRYYEVRMICDPMAEAPALSNDVDIPKGTLFYPLKLTTKHACV